MKKIFLLTLIMTWALGAACGSNDETAIAQQEDKSSSVQNKPVKIAWYEDWDKGFEVAKKKKKAVLVMFHRDNCRWCHEMDTKTFSAPEIKKQLADGWISLRIDTRNFKKSGTFYFDKSKKAVAVYLQGDKGNFEEKTMNYGQIAGFFTGGSVPGFLFIDKDGAAQTVVPGYWPKEEFAVILDFFKDEIYEKDISFEDYKKSRL